MVGYEMPRHLNGISRPSPVLLACDLFQSRITPNTINVNTLFLGSLTYGQAERIRILLIEEQ